jgi:hypothetical protein
MNSTVIVKDFSNLQTLETGQPWSKTCRSLYEGITFLLAHSDSYGTMTPCEPGQIGPGWPYSLRGTKTALSNNYSSSRVR